MTNGIEVLSFKSGDVLFYEGERTFYFYIIKQGEVEVYKENQFKEKTVLAKVGEGQSLGELALIDQKPRSASARAIGDVVAVKISEGAYKTMMEDLPTWAQAMFENMVERLRKANQIIMEQNVVSKQEREEFSSAQFSTQGQTVIQIEEDLAKIPSILPIEFLKKAS